MLRKYARENLYLNKSCIPNTISIAHAQEWKYSYSEKNVPGAVGESGLRVAPVGSHGFHADWSKQSIN
jgi:hypothetical protein